MAIADRDLDREKKIAIDDQKIADQSCLAYTVITLRPNTNNTTYNQALLRDKTRSG